LLIERSFRSKRVALDGRGSPADVRFVAARTGRELDPGREFIIMNNVIAADAVRGATAV
jgi:hypothetical protein